MFFPRITAFAHAQRKGLTNLAQLYAEVVLLILAHF